VGNYNSPLQATIKGIRDLYSKKKDIVHLPDHMNLQGKTVLITGASSGLGYAAAKRIAGAGATVIMAVRSGIPRKGEELKSTTGNPHIKMYFVDLLDFESIQHLIQNLKKDGVSVDILISNAAMVPLKSRRNRYGLEEMFMVNYLAPFYLINRMIGEGVIRAAAKIIIVSSESNRNPDGFCWDEFGVYRDYGINETVARYGYFKLLLTTFGCELSRRLNVAHCTMPVRMLCPGPVNSNIAREAPSWMQPILKLAFSLFFKSPEKASDPILYFATQNHDHAKSLEYLFLMQAKEIDGKALTPENGEKLWTLSEDLCATLGFPLK
jgi:NAD(P)-dependent dehydrogenase (short-subunit alcohol dehydrogenase family)